MLSNKDIQKKIRNLADKKGLKSDLAICEQCRFDNRSVLGKFDKLKNTPRLDTLDKFAQGLGCRIEDLIYDRTDADMEMSRIWDELSEYEKTETIIWIKWQQREKNKQKQSVAA